MEIRDLGIEIGAHTITHPQLDCIPASQAKEEIAGSKHALEDKLGLQCEVSRTHTAFTISLFAASWMKPDAIARVRFATR